MYGVDVHKTNISSTTPTMVCTVCLDNDASEAQVIADTKKSRKVHHQIHRRPEQNATDWIYSPATQKRILAKPKPSLRTSPPQEVVKVVKEDGHENHSQDNLRLGTKRNTPKHLKAVVLQSGALFAWSEAANQNPQVKSRDDPQEDHMFFVDQTQWEKVHSKAS